MEGYANKFEIARAFEINPLQTAKDMAKDREMQKDKVLMHFISMFLANFERYKRYAIISGLKGLNPFAKQGDGVEHGYYDYMKSNEYKAMKGIITRQAEIPEEYFDEKTQQKYDVLKAYFHSRGERMEERLPYLELNKDSLFHETIFDRTYEVLTKEEYKKLKLYDPLEDLEEPEYALFSDQAGNVVVDAEIEVVRDFLELNRKSEPEKEKEPVKEAETDAEKKSSELNVPYFIDNFFEYRVTPENKINIHRYLGPRESIKLPEKATFEGQEFNVDGIDPEAFQYSNIKQLAVNAEYWNAERFLSKTFLITTQKVPDIVWLNLTEEQKKNLEHNRAEAEKLAKEQEKTQEKEKEAAKEPEQSEHKKDRRRNR